MRHKNTDTAFAANHFAKTLQSLRLKRRLSQAQLADALGVSRGSISYYENMERIPDIEFLVLVHRYFEIGLHELLGCKEYTVDELSSYLEGLILTRSLLFQPYAENERQRQMRQALALAENRYFITILRGYILNGRKSAVFHIEQLDECCRLQLSCPLSEEEYCRLAASGYIPVLRSKLPVYIELHNDPFYASCAVKMTKDKGFADLFDALSVLQRELEHFQLNRD